MHTSVAANGSYRRTRRARTAQPMPVTRFGIHQFGRLAAAALVAATICVSAASLLARPEAPSPDTWATVSVPSYTTLWDLARAHGVEGLSTAATIELIRAENDLPSSTLYEGQTVRVPATAVSETTVAQR